MIFANVKSIQIPEGNVKQITQNGAVIWKEPDEEDIWPNSYQTVEYIKSTGTQWINTGVAGNNINLKIRIQYSWDSIPASGSYHNLICSYVNENTNATRILQYGQNTTYVTHCKRANRSSTKSLTRTIGTVYTEELTIDYYDINGARLLINEGATGSVNTTNLFIFSSPTGGSPAKNLRIFYVKLYDGSVLIRDFVPCYRKRDNEIGLYDLVEGVFYTNEGTGTFLKGQDVD